MRIWSMYYNPAYEVQICEDGKIVSHHNIHKLFKTLNVFYKKCYDPHHLMINLH